MQKLSILSCVVVVTSVFIYWLNVLSNNNTCTWVRGFDCQKNTSDINVSENKYTELSKISDLFLKYCKPKIREVWNNYVADYSWCDLEVSIDKDNTSVQKVLYDKNSLSREEINKIFK
jgi:hypothetical protein